MKDFGRALRVCRAVRGWTQEQVAAQARLSASYLSLIEAGQRTPSSKAVSRITAALRVPEALFRLLASEPTHLRKESEASRLGDLLLRLLVEAERPVAGD